MFGMVCDAKPLCRSMPRLPFQQPVFEGVLLTHRYRLTPEGTLIIRNAVPKDAGLYGCLASNTAGTVQETSILTYIGKYKKKQF